MKFKTGFILTLLCIGLAMPLAAETIGDSATYPLDGSPFTDGAFGGVYIYEGTPLFTQTGNAVSFRFFGSEFTTRVFTPLLFEYTGPIAEIGTIFTLKGIGTSVLNAGGQTEQTASFDLISGSASVGPNYTFGLFDGLVDTDGAQGVTIVAKNQGTLVAAHSLSSGPGQWGFTGGGTFITSLNPGTVFQVANQQGGSGTAAEPYWVYDRSSGNPGNSRRYPMNMTSSAVAAHPGDFDSDGDVDGADFVAWQTNFPKATEATLAQGDADSDGDVDGADFVVWQTNFPFTPGGGTAAVPEPASVSLALGGIVLLALRRIRR
jgi:hypothetical protein